MGTLLVVEPEREQVNSQHAEMRGAEHTGRH